MAEFEEKDILKAKGFIGIFLHKEDLTFVPVGDAPGQGYYSLPKSLVLREMHVKNLIVSKASQFMAKRMRPGASWGAGIDYLEVGTGVGTGTIDVPQPEDITQTALRVPLARKAIDAWTYLDASDNPTATETNVIQLTTTFTEAEAIGAIVEMGLSGGDATVALGSGYMFNYKVVPVWSKTADGGGQQLTIVWKLVF